MPDLVSIPGVFELVGGLGGESGSAIMGSWWKDLVLAMAAEKPSLRTCRISEVFPYKMEIGQ